MKNLRLDNTPENFKFAYKISLIGYSTTFVDINGDSWFITNQKLLRDEVESEEMMIRTWDSFDEQIERLGL